MKKFLFLIAVMLVAVAAAAQTPTATLSHAGNVKCFYGKEALVNAVAEADNGDNITISSGLFSGTTIDKSVTVKGAGMSPDTINGIIPTTINSDMTINSSDVTVEGVYIAANLTLNHFNNIKTVKSTVTGNVTCNYYDEYDGPADVRLSQYFLESKCYGAIRFEYYNSNIDLYMENAYVSLLYNYRTGTIFSSNSHIEARNSIIGICLNNSTFVLNSSFTNCFLFPASGSERDYIEPSNSVFYCVGLGSNIFSQDIGGSAGNTNATVENFSDVFKTFDGTYNDNETFELTSSAQNTFLGDDGTQIGIYGGNMPFNPKPNNPYITKLTVAEKSTPQGTLSVDIQVQPAQ